MATRAWAIVAVLAGTVAITGSLTAAPPDIVTVPEGPQAAGRLAVTLDGGKTTYALYEPVIVTFRVANPTNTTIRSSLTVRNTEGLLSIHREGGDSQVYQSGPSICSAPNPEMRFEANTITAGEIVAFFNDRAGHLAFPSPGRYRLSASAQVWTLPSVVVGSNPVWIDVREPSDIDRRAIDSLGSADRLVSLFRNGVKEYCRSEKSVEACAQSLRSVLRRHPESAYAPALTYYYGLAVAAGDLPLGPEDEQATEVFNGFLRRWAGHPLEADVTAALIREIHARGGREESFEWLHRFEKKFPDRSTQLQDLRARIE